MVMIYSNSRLWLYENCPEAYKIKYIDRTFPELPSSVHAFLGSMVHESLEFLYNEIKSGKTVELDELVKHFAENWHKQYTLCVRIPVGDKEGDYFNKGVKFLVDYFQSNKPFSENTIETERKILFTLDENYAIVGYIDRIVLNEKGEYEVHDYKTNSFLKSQEEIDKDRQLAFYQLGLQALFDEEIKVKLVWHFLAFDKKIHSKRTQEQLDKLKEETLELIKKIESTTEWSACGKAFCDWCSYKKLHGLGKEESSKKVFTRNGNLSG
ncbi:MAG: PD-(D/E)XK nuclease family protein [Nanoarchaeota archaeon]|nr:PD-(D/E)XK nuclease family protein [Nanoarchaeota archaeon]